MDNLLNDDDIKRLKYYIETLIRTGIIPENTVPFPEIKLPNQFIRKTIHQVYELTGKKYRGEFVKLIHLFKQFEGTEHTTTDSKFSTYEGNYEAKKSKITF